MGDSLNVEDPEAHRLAQAIAREGKATVEELLQIARRCASHVKGSYADHAELLYDEHGLPD